MIFVPQQGGSMNEPWALDWDGNPDTVPWIAHCRDDYADFHRFSFSPHESPVLTRDGKPGAMQTGYVMLELDGGAKFWVLGMVRDGVPDLPIWSHEEAKAKQREKESARGEEHK